MKIDHCVFFGTTTQTNSIRIYLMMEDTSQEKKEEKKDMNDKTNRFFMENKKKPNKQICESKT